MRIRWRLPRHGLICLAVFSLPAPAVAQTEGAPGVHPEFASLPTIEDLERRIAKWREERQRQDASTAELELENVMRLKEQLGLRSLVPLGTALRLEGRKALAGGEVEVGLRRLAQAAILIPDTPAIHYELGLAQLQHGGGAVPAVESFVRGVRARANGFENRALLLSDTLGVVGSAWMLALALFLVVQLVRYLDMAGHDLRRGLRLISGVQGRLLVLLLLFAPLALGMGVLPFLVLGLALVGLYQTRRERLVTVGGLLGILGLVAAVYFSAPLLAFRDSDARAIHIVATRGGTVAVRARAERAAERDPEAAFVLGLDARRRGDLRAAESWYRRSLAAGKNARRLNNLGNLMLFQQKTEQAKQLYQEASAFGTHAEPSLNLAAVLIEEGDAAGARAKIEIGRALSPNLADDMRVEVVGVPAVRKVRDAPYDEAVLLPMLLASGEGTEPWPLLDDLAARLLGGIPAIGFAAAIVIFIVLLIALRKGPTAISTACERCGAPAPRGPDEPHCSACHAVFFDSSAADPKVRFSKEQEIRRRRRFERWRERMLAPLAGGGDIVAGQPLTGFTLLFLLSFSIAHVLWLRHYGFYPWPEWSEPESWRLIVSATVGVPVTLISLKRGLGV